MIELIENVIWAEVPGMSKKTANWIANQIADKMEEEFEIKRK